ncbi:MAG: hypothetical protein IID38_07510 [Planctomycetes bacterium]|nr:hypothetical protein [Planctomycetota bacterium]
MVKVVREVGAVPVAEADLAVQAARVATVVVVVLVAAARAQPSPRVPQEVQVARPAWADRLGLPVSPVSAVCPVSGVLVSLRYLPAPLF